MRNNKNYQNWKKGENGLLHHERSDPIDNLPSKIIIEARYNWALNIIKKYNLKSVIDIGCGLGYGTNLINKMGYYVIGIDKSVEAISKARRRYPNIEFIVNDATNINIKRKFDACIAFEIIEHLYDYLSAVKCWVSLLNQKGRLLISTPRYSNKRKNPHHIKEFTYRELKELFQKTKIKGLKHKFIRKGILRILFTEEKALRIGYKLDLLMPLPKLSGLYLLSIEKNEINLNNFGK